MKDLRAEMFINEKEAYFNVEEVFLKYGYLQIYIITSMNQRKANHFKVTLQTFILVNWTMCPLWMGKIRDNFQGIPFSCWCSTCLPLLVYFKDWNHRTIGPQRGIFSTRIAAKPLGFFPITVKHALSRKKPQRNPMFPARNDSKLQLDKKFK